VRWELDWLENRARITPEKIAVIDAESTATWSFGQINERAKSTAHWLMKRGVKKGDRVALLAPNHISYFDILFACGKIGAIFVPLNWRLSINELNDILLDSLPKLVGIHVSFLEHFSSLAVNSDSSFLIGNPEYDSFISSTNLTFKDLDHEIVATDPLLMIYTGGTTGKPKGVVLTHQSVMWNGINTAISWDLSSNDVTLTNIPMFHTGGLNALSIPILLMGGTVVIADQFEPTKAIHFLQKYRCTIVLFIPTMYHMMIQTEVFRKSRFPDMKIFLSGGAPCPLEIYEAFWEKNLLFKEGYGLTEAGPNNFYIDPKEAYNKKGSVGKPMLFNQIKLVKDDGTEAKENEVGEIWIKGKHCFSHYWNNEEATLSTIHDGWLCSGDLAKKDEDGYFYIVGRKKDMIISGGENVYPLEVEQWLLTHPFINEVAVIGLPDEKWGEMVTAFLVVQPLNQLQEDELRGYCAHKLGKYKIPKKFLQLTELPKTHVGKIDKKELKTIGMEYLNSVRNQKD
jgi:fatty-acyl-CoA synthase